MQVVSDKELRVALTTGAVVILHPNEPRTLSPEIAIAAMQLGAKAVAAEVPPEALRPFSEHVPVAVPPAKTHEEVVKDYMREIRKKGDPANFRQDGKPKSSLLSRHVGRTVVWEDIERLWDEVLRE